MITILVNSIGIILMLVIIGWFWLSHPESVALKKKNIIEIKVKNGVYQPANIRVPLHQPFTLRFIRQDASPCADAVIFHALHINQALPLGGTLDIPLTLDQAGEYEFSCQMGMYRGKLIAH
ncbi:MAG: hypothetical protein A3J38_07020 [Gammaproteobacteria bacterium RIFCSPHIGHO2_12_FULL_45_9]|nr:MAG: hypothetical protein A3J38_07020 [Gammaproteobacteria bacterium RIFCSPHIGHO2_12_FULL_45_9]